MAEFIEEEKKYKLPIPPMILPDDFKMSLLPESLNTFAIKPGKALELKEAVVCYVDIMGFSKKRTNEDLEMTLADFAGALFLPAHQFPYIRFHVFSDCAFIATSIEHASDLLSAIRYAFTQWIADSILVRGGIAIGSYKENRSHVREIAPENFSWAFFAGSAVAEAVKIEQSKKGALLYSSDNCAELFEKSFGEPIFIMDNAKIIGWTSDFGYLYWYVGNSLLRMLKILSIHDGETNPVVDHYMANIFHALTIGKKGLTMGLIMAILSMPNLNVEARQKALKLLKISNDDISTCKPLVDEIIRNNDLNLLARFADSDSSVPGSLFDFPPSNNQ